MAGFEPSDATIQLPGRPLRRRFLPAQFPVTRLERTRWRGGRYACEKGGTSAAELACLDRALQLARISHQLERIRLHPSV